MTDSYPRPGLACMYTQADLDKVMAKAMLDESEWCEKHPREVQGRVLINRVALARLLRTND